MYEDYIEIVYENQIYHHMFLFGEILMNYDLGQSLETKIQVRVRVILVLDYVLGKDYI